MIFSFEREKERERDGEGGMDRSRVIWEEREGTEGLREEGDGGATEGGGEGGGR